MVTRHEITAHGVHEVDGQSAKAVLDLGEGRLDSKRNDAAGTGADVEAA